MLVQEIEMTKPLKLQTDDGSDVYLTHSVWTDAQEHPFALLTSYDEEIHVFPARYNEESETFEAVEEELADVIRAYVEENPIDVLTAEQVKEVTENE